MTVQAERRRPGLIPWQRYDLEFVPWWALILFFLSMLVISSIFNNDVYRGTFLFLRAGVELTIRSTLIAFSIALVLGLITGMGRVSKNPLFYTPATLYVEVVRGIPIIVQLLYVAFVVVPAVIQLGSSVGAFLAGHTTLPLLLRLAESMQSWDIKNVDMMVRGITGLSVAYGAYEAEVFRAGIESIEKGQMEAARSLGMSYFQAMRYIILPQAIRRVLPPLGNDFISMLKDSSLLSVLAIRELTQLGKLNRARTFQTYPTWNTVAFLYLIMTLALSRLVGVLEKEMSIGEHRRQVGVDVRMVAGLLDLAFLYGLISVVVFIAGRLVGLLGRWGVTVSFSRTGSFVLLAVFAVPIYFLYSWVKSGQTIGKSMFGYRLVSTEGTALRWDKAVIRFVVTAIFLAVGGAMIIPGVVRFLGAAGAPLLLISLVLLTFSVLLFALGGRRAFLYRQLAEAEGTWGAWLAIGLGWGAAVILSLLAVARLGAPVVVGVLLLLIGGIAYGSAPRLGFLRGVWLGVAFGMGMFWTVGYGLHLVGVVVGLAMWKAVGGGLLACLGLAVLDLGFRQGWTDKIASTQQVRV